MAVGVLLRRIGIAVGAWAAVTDGTTLVGGTAVGEEAPGGWQPVAERITIRKKNGKNFTWAP
jgi:hypothetical protein